MKRTLVTLVMLLALIGGGLALATVVRPIPLPRTIEVVPPVTSKLMCAPMTDDDTLFTDGAETLSQLGEREVPASGPTLQGEQSVPAVIRGGPALVGGIATVGSATRAWVPCAPPRSQGTLLVPSTVGTDLLVINPDASEAVVDLTLYGTDGELVALGARGIAVGPHSSRTIALSVLADQEGPVGVDFSTSRGRATVVARTNTPDVLEAATSSTAGRQHWLAGIPKGATVASLLVTNPGTDRATVEVMAHGTSVAYQPEGGTGVSVPAHSTVAVELGASLAGEATGLEVTSDVDVAVGLSTGTGTDLAFASPVPDATQLGAFVPAGGVLQLSNPSATQATAFVAVGVVEGARATVEHAVPAGATLSIPLEGTAPKGQTVSVNSDVALFGAIADATAGVSAVPLSSTGTVLSEPVDAEIVPTLH